MNDLTRILIITAAYFLVGAGLLILVNRKTTDKNQKLLHWKKYLVYLAVVSLMLLGIYTDKFFLVATLFCIIAIGEVCWVGIQHGQISFIKLFVSLVLVSVTGFCLLFMAMMFPVKVMLFVYTLVFTFDGFSQLTGQLLGRMRFVKRVSPNKTLEGFIGGAFFTVITSILLCGMINVTWTYAVLVGLGVSCSALLGDLTASAYKRMNGIKDYSGLIPGHGGILDRFDSLFGAAVFMTMLFYIVG